MVTAPPIAAKPGQLREQLEANRAIIDNMDRKLADLEVVRQDAEKMIEEAGGVEDESVQGTMNMIGESSVTSLLIGQMWTWLSQEAFPCQACLCLVELR